MRKFTTHIYTKANYLLNRGRMALSNQRRQDHYRRSFGCAAPGGSDPHLQ